MIKSCLEILLLLLLLDVPLERRKLYFCACELGSHMHLSTTLFCWLSWFFNVCLLTTGTNNYVIAV